jgi:hypothetical protein
MRLECTGDARVLLRELRAEDAAQLELLLLILFLPPRLHPWGQRFLARLPLLSFSLERSQLPVNRTLPHRLYNNLFIFSDFEKQSFMLHKILPPKNSYWSEV